MKIISQLKGRNNTCFVISFKFKNFILFINLNCLEYTNSIFNLYDIF